MVSARIPGTLPPIHTRPMNLIIDCYSRIPLMRLMLLGRTTPKSRKLLTNITSSGNLQRPPKAMRLRSRMPMGAYGRHDGIRLYGRSTTCTIISPSLFPTPRMTVTRSVTVVFDIIPGRQSHTPPPSPSLAPLRSARSARCCAPRPRGGESLPSGALSPLGSVGR